MDERLKRTAAAVAEAEVDWVLLTRGDSVAYAANHIPSVEVGRSPFAGGPTTAFVSSEGICGLVAPNVEAGAAKAAWAESALYEGYSYDHGADLVANYLRAVRSLAGRLGVGGRVAVERETQPASLAGLFDIDEASGFETAFRNARATKTAAERFLLRQAGEAAAAGQHAFLRSLRPGVSELQLFDEVRSAIDAMGGERVALTGDFVSGAARTAGISGWPGPRLIEVGDPVICDLSPRVAGYWGDSCATVACRSAGPGFRKLFAASHAAITRAAEIIRPGLAIAALDAELRRVVGLHGYRYPHHSGHSLGTSPHEWPRLVPYEQAVLEEGMILAVEPGAYEAETGGVRLEWMFEVTSTGALVSTPFDFLEVS